MFSNKLISLLLIFLTAVFLAGCSFNDVDINEPDTITEIVEESTEMSAEANPEYEISFTENPDNPSLVDIIVIKSTVEDVLSITVKNLDINLFHKGEFTGENLYVIKSFDRGEEGRTSELWRYGVNGDSKQLMSGDSIDFRVSPDEKFIVVLNWDPDKTGNDQIVVLSQAGEQIKVYTPSNNYSNDISWSPGLGEWTEDGSLFWGAYYIAYRPMYFYIIDTKNWELSDYDASSLPLQADYDFNPNTRQLAFSDNSVFFTVDGYLRDLIKQTPVRLYLHDYQTNEQVTLAVAIAQSFNPEWISDDQIVYDDPAGRGRIIYNLNDASTRLIPTEPDQLVLIQPKIIPPSFEEVMEDLLSTGVGIMLPETFPLPEGSYLVSPELNSRFWGSYWVSLELGGDCIPGQSCSYGLLGARKFGAGGGAEASLMPFWGDDIVTYAELFNRITGYYVEPSCDTCNKSALYWIYNNTEYMLRVNNTDREGLVTIANDMLKNSIQDSDK